MLPLPALRAPSHALRPHTLGLTICQRTFTTTPTTLLRRLPHRFSPPPRTATLPSSRHPLLLATAAAALTIPFFSLHTRNDASPAAPDFSSSAYTHGRDAKVPITKDGGLNPAAIRQISFGSLAGLGLGVLVSAFSRMLVLVIGISVVAVQYAARKGYNIIPVERLQRSVKEVNIRSAINDNAAFKISFGLMFALTAFGEF